MSFKGKRNFWQFLSRKEKTPTFFSCQWLKHTKVWDIVLLESVCSNISLRCEIGFKSVFIDLLPAACLLNKIKTRRTSECYVCHPLLSVLSTNIFNSFDAHSKFSVPLFIMRRRYPTKSTSKKTQQKCNLQIYRYDRNVGCCKVVL